MPVPLLQQVIDSAHFSELLAEERLHGPRGERRADYRAAQICRGLVLPWVAKGARVPPVEEYLLDFRSPDEAPPRRQTAQEQALIAMQLCVSMGGTVNLGS